MGPLSRIGSLAFSSHAYPTVVNTSCRGLLVRDLVVLRLDAEAAPRQIRHRLALAVSGAAPSTMAGKVSF